MVDSKTEMLLVLHRYDLPTLWTARIKRADLPDFEVYYREIFPHKAKAIKQLQIMTQGGVEKQDVQMVTILMYCAIRHTGTLDDEFYIRIKGRTEEEHPPLHVDDVAYFQVNLYPEDMEVMVYQTGPRYKN